MTTVRETIRTGYRRAGIIAAGVRISAQQYEIGLERLQSLYHDLVSKGTLGRFTEKVLSTAAAYEIQEGEKVFNKMGATITYPVTVTDPRTGDERAPNDGAIVAVVQPNTAPSIRIYDAFKASWQNIESLTLNSEAPLTFTYDDGIKNMLAVLLADDTGTPISPMLARLAGVAKLAIASKYHVERAPAEVSYS